MCSGNICLNGVGHCIHTCVGNQFFGHGLCQIRINDCHIRGDLEIGDGVLDTLCVICDDRESSYFCCSAGGRRNRTEVCLLPELRDAEYLTHFLKGDIRVLIFDPHSLCRIDGGTAAHCDDPVRLELLHGCCALHNGFNGGIRLDAFKELNFHTGFL